MGAITVLNPLGFNRVESRAISARVPSLGGIRLGVLNNSKPNSEYLQERIAALLGERFSLASVAKKAKPNPAIGADNLDQYAGEVQAVITAIGD